LRRDDLGRDEEQVVLRFDSTVVIVFTAVLIGVAVPAAAGNSSRPAIAKASMAGQETGKASRPPQSLAFGVKLANAALARRWTPVIYNPAYVKIAYPGGDVPWYTGVCTDVVVRAYRALSIDLQINVHKAGIGARDTNIDHRRVRMLRKFFARKGKSLSIAKNPTLYKPGDIVTMYVADGTFSKTHIAIVTQYKSSSGVPLIVHNRGYGVQLEDWLFAKKITGHYRYSG
jgi:uncharacterized protein YijF (DUF1287 family)